MDTLREWRSSYCADYANRILEMGLYTHTHSLTLNRRTTYIRLHVHIVFQLWVKCIDKATHEILSTNLSWQVKKNQHFSQNERKKNHLSLSESRNYHIFLRSIAKLSINIEIDMLFSMNVFQAKPNPISLASIYSFNHTIADCHILL